MYCPNFDKIRLEREDLIKEGYIRVHIYSNYKNGITTISGYNEDKVVKIKHIHFINK